MPLFRQMSQFQVVYNIIRLQCSLQRQLQNDSRTCLRKQIRAPLHRQVIALSPSMTESIKESVNELMSQTSEPGDTPL